MKTQLSKAAEEALAVCMSAEWDMKAAVGKSAVAHKRARERFDYAAYGLYLTLKIETVET